jgi:hypothetical protein
MEEHNDIEWKGHIGPKIAAAIGALAGLAVSRRRMKGALVGGAVGWAMAHLLNRRRHAADVVDVPAEPAPPAG